MASTPPHGLAQILPTEEETPYSTPKLRPATRRTPSFSSSSRSNSSDSSFDSSPFFFNDASPPQSPIISLKLMGIPFSWEQTPGIPKKGFKKTETSSRRLLPLPPAVGTTTPSSAKKWRSGHEEISPKKHPTRFKRDPFFAALVECSKDDDDLDHAANIWKGSLSDRFGFINMYTSCKKTCAVSESIVYVPRATPHYLLHDHRRRSS
ncbi:hypothetical protein C2S52_011657 [Perilla frutescens var. hirtella]|nr:hypothetical protein C2S52_011657 [Perilla frutescens var. hirtella]KAH6785708.1 hypothetical protein C2S51_038163 [Perilla frutescens var. frutescens]